MINERHPDSWHFLGEEELLRLTQAPLFEIRCSNGQRFAIFCNGQIEGLIGGATVINRALPLLNSFQALEPTPEMVDAGVSYLIEATGFGDFSEEAVAKGVYKAMRAALLTSLSRSANQTLGAPGRT